MALTEEVFENNGKLFTAHSGREVKRGDCEMVGGSLWTKCEPPAPNFVVSESEEEPGKPHGSYC